VVPFGGGQTERQVQLIDDFRPDIIMVTPSYMLAIADEFERQGLDPRASSLRLGIFGAEPWTNDMRGQIEQRMGLDAVDIYGLSEGDGPGRGQRVRGDQGRPDDLGRTISIRDRRSRNRRAGADGEFGELVFTSLTKEALPIIRYRTRDLTRLLPGTARTMRRMEKITGRSDDMMIVRGVNVFPTQIEELILKRVELAPHYQCILTREGPAGRADVRVEAGRPAARARHGAARDRLAHEIKVYIGTTPASTCGRRGHRAQPGQGEAVVDHAAVEGGRLRIPGLRGMDLRVQRTTCSIFHHQVQYTPSHHGSGAPGRYCRLGANHISR
jgi:phenylacetate-CoA ligase